MREKINLMDTEKEVLMKLSEEDTGGYNPGALNVCMNLLKDGDTIDPQAAFGGMSHLLNLDSYNIYGHRIWMLYKDVCHEDLIRTVAVLRAMQLGIAPEKDVQHAIDNRGQGIDVDALLAAVKERLPEFGKTLVM